MVSDSGARGSSISGFTVGVQHVFPRSWFKGADTATLLLYLEDKLGEVLPSIAEADKSYFRFILKMIKQCNVFMRALYHAGLWLLDGERDAAIESGMAVLSHFKQCAIYAYKWELTRWKMQPKLHCMGEILFRLERERREDLPSMNPLASGTQIDEDFVGRVCAMSRTVSGRQLHTRTLRKYCLALPTVW